MRPDWWTIEGEMTIFWSITKLGRSVRRVIREGSLALFRTSYKGLSQRGIHPSSGVHHLFLKETSFTQNQLASHWPSLVCPISPPLLNGFQSSLISLESYFQGESNAVCYEGRGLLFMETLAITEIAPPGSPWSYLMYIQSGLILSEHFPLRLGCSPLIVHHWKPSLVWISGINMGFTSSISRV